MEAHHEAVKRISSSVRSFYAAKTPFRIYHGSTLSTRPSPRTKSNTVDISDLNHVLSINAETLTALVEPNVPMDALIAATMPLGLLPPVVMELPNITTGGGFAGTSGESSSYRYGTFDCTVNSIEVVLGNGDVVMASADDPETRELLFGCANACGTLGIVTLLELELIKSKDYVELTYHPVHSTSEAIQELQAFETDPTIDYIDAILYSPTSGVIMTGRLTNTPLPHTTPQTFENATDPWFYLHAQSILKSNPDPSTPYKETIPTPSYLFRYDRSVFWSGKIAFDYFLTPCNTFTRWLLDPLMRTRVVNHALHRSGLASRGIIQDLGIPYSNAEAFISYISSTLNFWPLWLCPVRTPLPLNRASFSMGNQNIALPDTVLDIGVWGMGPANELQFIKLNRDIEKKIRELGGVKCLYAHAYYTEEEFWEIYDEGRYRGLRRKWKAETLPSVFDKVRVDLRGVDGGEVGEIGGPGEWMGAGWVKAAIGRIWGLFGVLSAVKMMLFGGTFLLKK